MFVRIPNDVELKLAELYDINGSLIYSNKNSIKTRFVIDSEDLNTGVYFLKIQTKEGEIGNYKVVKI
ncbi:MAG: T9SS type A sorting domain-containing protein [Flavobacteriales bacterium]|nr:T9SS type A sorting domain-containing protein [Flavobacteriales bacterium]